MYLRIIKLLLFISCIVITTAAVYAENRPSLSSLLKLAKASVIENNYENIVTKLSPYSYNYAGDANFDYYLGTAYLELEQYSEAIFALESAILTNPHFAGAMFELARAYFHSKEYSESKRIFNRVLELSPPKNIKSAITTYLRAITNKDNLYQTIHLPTASFSIGYDTNANNATGIRDINGITLADKNIETASSYYTLLLSDSYSKSIAPDWRWKSKGAVYLRGNPSAEFVDMNVEILQTGLEWSNDNNITQLDIGLLRSRVKGEAFNIEPSLATSSIDYQTENLDREGSFINSYYKLDANSTSSYEMSVKISKYSHEKVLELRDMTQYLLSAGYMANFESSWQLRLTLFAVEDKMDIESSPYANKKLAFQLAIVNQLTSEVISRLGLQYAETDYEGSFFGHYRIDKQSSADWTSTWLINENLSYWGKVIWVDNNSNDAFELYSYKKSAVEFGVNYQF